MRMDVQVLYMCGGTWFNLYNIDKIRHYLTDDRAKIAVHAYVPS